jgi:uncharacterized cupredoxin-like copper-binding protein
MRKMAALGAVLIFVTLAACSSEKGTKATLDEYSINLSDDTLEAGPQTFSVTDRGQIAHQFLVLRTNDAPDDLPVAKDGIVKLGAKSLREVAEIELLSPGEHKTLETKLQPGRYVLICNIAGHYSSGMRAGFRVT